MSFAKYLPQVIFMTAMRGVFRCLCPWFGRICLPVNYDSVGGCGGYTSCHHQLWHLSWSRHKLWHHACCLYFSQSTVVPGLFLPLPRSSWESTQTSWLHHLTHVFPVGMKSAQQLGCQEVSFLQNKTGITGCGRFQRILLTHCCLPCCSAMNC